MVKFSPENTAIDTRNSKSAVMVADKVKENTKVLDYGCGTGRNIKYILEKTNAIVVDGTDIIQQLKKEKAKHDILREKGSLIELSEKLPSNYYDIILNSHVLNVVEKDEIKENILADMYDKLLEGGTAIIEVRTKKDIEGAKTKEPYGDGWKIKKGNSFTYQEAISKQKIETLVKNAGFEIVEHLFNTSNHIIIIRK